MAFDEDSVNWDDVSDREKSNVTHKHIEDGDLDGLPRSDNVDESIVMLLVQLIELPLHVP
jgi:hypothetical protein